MRLNPENCLKLSPAHRFFLSSTPAAEKLRRRHPSVVLVLSAVFALIAVLAPAVPLSQAQGFGTAERVVQGWVVDAAGAPRPDAIVYLKNQKTLEIKTYITTEGGHYRFGQLNSDVDYQLWARYKKSKSKTKSISSFDSKKLFEFELKLEPEK